MAKRTRTRSDYERFMAFVDDSGGPGSCHPWMGARNSKGYGSFNADGRVQLAPRWLLGHLRGKPLATEEWACHHCDNGHLGCVNRDHLYIGDASTNMQDAYDHGRKFKTHCVNGHPFDDANTLVLSSGKRQCRACSRDRMRDHRGTLREFDRPNGEKTHCPQGHPYDEENTYWTPSGSRNCRACGRENARKRRARS